MLISKSKVSDRSFACLGSTREVAEGLLWLGLHIALVRCRTLSSHPRITSLEPELTLVCRPEGLILLHGEIDFALAVLAHDESDRREQDAVDQVEAALSARPQGEWTNTMVRLSIRFLIGIIPSVYSATSARCAPRPHPNAREAEFQPGVDRVPIIRVEVRSA